VIEIVQFFSWTLLLYWIHRVAHSEPMLLRFHMDHHRYIRNNDTEWNINNLFLFNDTIDSTVDLWITEVIPTIIFALAFNAWWVFWLYYIWAAFFQEDLEHSDLDLYPFTAGKWHMVHHSNPNKNFGLFFPFWDRLFKTENE
jgi:lathosterol oxidase